MPHKFQNKYRIEPNRWQFWNYSAPGSYFITICVTNHKKILGWVQNHQMKLSETGNIVKTEFLKIPAYHHRAQLDEWVVMPNHVHCIITLGEYDANESIGDDAGIVPQGDDVWKFRKEKIREFSLQNPPGDNQPPENDIKQYRRQRRHMLIPKIVGKFQMQTSKQMNILHGTPGKINWQANYYDRVIRDEAEYTRIRQYIIHNPANWHDDKFYH